jgi:hypothetical protein
LHTCVGFRYGPTCRPRGAFRGRDVDGLPDRNAVALAGRGLLSPRSIASRRPPRFTLHVGWRNINRLPIGCASRPGLRSRLTLGGLTFPRKPCAFGGWDSHPSDRYSFRHNHSSPLHRSSRFGFAAGDDALLPCEIGDADLGSATAARRLSPRHFRRGIARPVSCYALLKWWLLLSQHPGCHGDPTSFITRASILGPWSAVWAVSLSSAKLIPRALTPGLARRGIRSWVSAGRR